MAYLTSGKSVESIGTHKYRDLRVHCNKLFFKVTEHRPLFWAILNIFTKTQLRSNNPQACQP